MKKCKSYHEFVCKRKPTAFERGFYLATTGEYLMEFTETKAYCYGTKDCEECECEGDRRKCKFYPENRKPENVAKYEKEHAPKFGKWISVKDKLPPINQPVLVYTMRGIFALDYRYSGAEEVGDSEFCHYAVDFWMPLPEPPKK